MKSSQAAWITLIGLVVLVAGAYSVGYLSPAPNAGFKDASAVLALSATVAVGIERAIEGFWTVVGELKNKWWPLDAPQQAIDGLVTDLNSAIAPFYEQAAKTMDQIASTNQWTVQDVMSAKGQLEALRQKVADIQSGASSRSDVQASATLAIKSIDYVQRKYQDPKLKTAAASATKIINGAANFVDSMKENPGRKLISLYLGSVMGLAVAGIGGIDLIHAAAGTTSTGQFHWGIVISGLVLGLGSNPTHEVIRSIQEYKQARKAA